MKKISHYPIALAMLLAVLTLIGWAFDMELLKRPYANAVGMNPLTAACLTLLSLSFMLLYKTKGSNVAKSAGTLLAIAVIVIGLLKILNFEGFNIPVDQLLFKQKILAERAAGRVNRMPPNAALGVLLIGASLLLWPLRHRQLRAAINYLNLTVLILGLFSFISIIYRVQEHYGILNYLPMAIQTAIALMCFAIGLMFENDDSAFMRQIGDDHTGGKIARWLVPGVIVVPVLVGYVRLHLLTWDNSFSVELGVSALITSIIIIFISTVLYMARVLNISDKKRRVVEAQLERQAQLLGIMPDAVVYGNRDLTINGMNPAAEALLDIHLHEMTGRRLDDFVTVEVIGDTRERVREELWKDKGQWRGEILFTTGTGKKVNVLATVKITKDEDGKEGFMAVYTDISPLKKIQERLELALDGMAAGLWEWNIQQPEKGWFSARYLQLLGYQADELKPSVDTFKSLIHPDEVVQVLTYFRQQAQQKEAFEIEVRYKTKAGVYKWFAVSGKARFNSKGEATSMIGSIIDIDEKKKAQALVQQQADLIQMMPDGIIYGDTQNRVISLNSGAEKMLGITLHEARGKKVDELITVKVVGEERSTISQKFDQLGFLRQEMELTNKRGEKIMILVTVKKFDNLIGNEQGWICVYTDISPLKVNDHLRAANDYLEQLAYISAHDIKSPVLTLAGLTELQIRSKRLAGNDMEVLLMQKEVVQQMQRTNKGLNDILQLREKLAAQNSRGSATSPLQTVIAAALLPLQPQIEDTNTTIQLKLGDAATVQLPHPYIQMALNLLFDNALKFRHPQVPLTIIVSAALVDKETLKLTIADNGLGIDLKHNEHKVFGIFKRFHPTIEGTGVGLHMAKSIIEAYGGSITLSSIVNSGTTFQLYLKLAMFA